MFEHSTTKEAHADIITIMDNSITVVRGMLEFMYSGEIENVNENIEELLAIAEEYKVAKLKIICEEKLIGKLDKNTVCPLLHIAHNHSADCLKSACLDFIRRNEDVR